MQSDLIGIQPATQCLHNLHSVALQSRLLCLGCSDAQLSVQTSPSMIYFALCPSPLSFPQKIKKRFVEPGTGK